MSILGRKASRLITSSYQWRMPHRRPRTRASSAAARPASTTSDIRPSPRGAEVSPRPVEIERGGFIRGDEAAPGRETTEVGRANPIIGVVAGRRLAGAATAVVSHESPDPLDDNIHLGRADQV